MRSTAVTLFKKSHLRFLVVSLLLGIASPVYAEDSAPSRGILARNLFSDEFAQETALDVRGWLSAGANWNPSKHDRGFNGPVSFADQADRGQLDQFYSELYTLQTQLSLLIFSYERE